MKPITKNRRKKARKHWPATEQPRLRFTPTAWAKFIYFRDRGRTEIGAFGIAPTGDPLLIADIRLVEQECSVVTTALREAAIADFFDQMIDQGLKPSQFARVWLHTHPGSSAIPSQTDEETFANAFGGADFAVMAILARDGQTYARLQFNAGPRGSLRIPVEVDFQELFTASDFAGWEEEYRQCIHILEPVAKTSGLMANAVDRLGETGFGQFTDDPFLSLEMEKPWYVD